VVLEGCCQYADSKLVPTEVFGLGGFATVRAMKRGLCSAIMHGCWLTNSEQELLTWACSVK